MPVPPSAGAGPPQSPLSKRDPKDRLWWWRAWPVPAQFGGALKGLQPWQFSPSSAVFLSFILPGVAEPPRKVKEAGGSPTTLGWELGTTPGSPWIPSTAVVGTPRLVCPLCCPSRLIPGLPTAQNSTERNSTARLRGQAGFQLATAFPAHLKAVCVQGLCLPARRDKVAPSLSPQLPAQGSRPLPCAPCGWGQWGAQSRSRSGVRGKRQELNSH